MDTVLICDHLKSECLCLQGHARCKENLYVLSDSAFESLFFYFLP